METKETQENQEVGQEPKVDSLSTREAIQVAVAKVESGEAATTEAPSSEALPTKTEVKELVNEVEPPAEFSAKAKEAWKNKDYKTVNEEYLRLHNSRTIALTRAQQEKDRLEKEVRPVRDLSQKVKDYFAVRGDLNIIRDC